MSEKEIKKIMELFDKPRPSIIIYGPDYLEGKKMAEKKIDEIIKNAKLEYLRFKGKEK